MHRDLHGRGHLLQQFFPKFGFFVSHQIHHAHDGRQWASQIVCENRKEFVLFVVGRFKFLRFLCEFSLQFLIYEKDDSLCTNNSKAETEEQGQDLYGIISENVVFGYWVYYRVNCPEYKENAENHKKGGQHPSGRSVRLPAIDHKEHADTEQD